jgi:hypothetical protein
LITRSESGVREKNFATLFHPGVALEQILEFLRQCAASLSSQFKDLPKLDAPR